MRSFSLAAIAILCVALQVRGQDAVQTTALPGVNPKLFAIQPETGAVLFASSNKPIVTMCPRLASEGVIDQSVSQKLDTPPTQIIYKRFGRSGYFFVLSQTAGTIYQLDPASLRIVNKLTLNNPVSSIAAPQDPAIGYIYYGTPTGIGRIDWNKTQDKGYLSCDLQGQQDVTDDIAVTAEGDSVFVKSEPNRGSFGIAFALTENSDGSASLHRTSSLNGTITAFVPDPNDDAMAFDRSFQQNNGASPSEAYADIPHTSIGFMATRPLFFTLWNGEFVVYSLNSSQELDRVAMTNLQQQPYYRGNDPEATVILADEKHNTVLVVSPGQVQTISLNSMNLPTEPILNVNLGSIMSPGPRNPMMTIELIRANPDEKVELASGPSGMTLQGSQLVWDSRKAPIGIHPLTLRVSADGVSRVQRFNIVTAYPHANLPFAATGLSLSPDGHYAAAYQSSLPQYYNQPNGNRESASIAVIDLQKMLVISSATINQNIQYVGIDDDHVFVASQNVNSMFVYPTNDLRQERRIFLTQPVESLSVAARRLFVSSGFEMSVFEEPNVTPAKGIFRFPTIDDARRDPYMMLMQMIAPKRVNDQWFFNGCFYNADMTRVLSVYQPRNFSTYPTSGPDQPMNAPARFADIRPPGPWGLRLEGNALYREPRTTVGTLPMMNNAGKILDALPAVACVSVDRSNVNRYNRFGGGINAAPLVVDFYDLVSVKRQSRIVLNENSDMADPGQLQAAAGVVAVLQGTTLFVVPVSDLDAAKFPVPPMVTVDQPLPVIDPTRPTNLKFTAQGLVGAVTYSLESDYPGVSIDPQSGVVTFDGPAMATVATRSLANELARPAQYGLRTPMNPDASPPSAEGLIDMYTHRIAMQYQRIFGHELKNGVPVALRLTVVARDADQQEVPGICTAFLELPVPTVSAAINERLSQQPAAIPGNNPAMASLQQQIEELKKKNQELEAQNRLLKEMILEKQGGTPARP